MSEDRVSLWHRGLRPAMVLVKVGGEDWAISASYARALGHDLLRAAAEAETKSEQKSEGPPVAADEPSVKPTDIACEWGESNSHGGKPTGS